MYALGHMMLGYLTVRAFDRVCKTRTSTWLALTVGMVPDIDLLFVPFGLEHHTYTHSILLWLPFLALGLVCFSTRFIPVYFGVVQHMLDDMLVGPVPLFLPLSGVQVGLNFGVPSPADTLMETASFEAAALVAFRNGDVSRLLSRVPECFMSIVPLAAISSMTLMASHEFKVNLVQYAFSSRNLTMISLCHIVVASFLTISFLQGVRARAKH